MGASAIPSFRSVEADAGSFFVELVELLLGGFFFNRCISLLRSRAIFLSYAATAMVISGTKRLVILHPIFLMNRFARRSSTLESHPQPLGAASGEVRIIGSMLTWTVVPSHIISLNVSI